MKLFSVNKKDKNTIELSGITFNYVQKEDEDFIKCVISDNHTNSWNLNFENIIAYNTENWQNIIYRIIDNTLCFFCYYPNDKQRIIDFAFKPLLIDTSKETNISNVMNEIKEILCKINNTDKPHMVYICDSDRETYKKYIKFHKSKFFNEFLYNLEYLYNLEGSHFKNIRRDFNRFERDYPNVILKPYDKNVHLNGCRKLLDIWELDYYRRWKEQPLWYNSTNYYFDNLTNTETSHAYVLLDGDKVIGYMNAVYMYDDYCCCIKRITDNSYINSSNYILISVVKELYKLGYRHMNDGNAGGETDKSLGSFKMKYIKQDESYENYLYSGIFK